MIIDILSHLPIKGFDTHLIRYRYIKKDLGYIIIKGLHITLKRIWQKAARNYKLGYCLTSQEDHKMRILQTVYQDWFRRNVFLWTKIYLYYVQKQHSWLLWSLLMLLNYCAIWLRELHRDVFCFLNPVIYYDFINFTGKSFFCIWVIGAEKIISKHYRVSCTLFLPETESFFSCHGYLCFHTFLVVISTRGFSADLYLRYITIIICCVC